MIFLALSLTYSLLSFSPSYFQLLLLVLLSGFKRLGTSLVPRSNSPLPFMCEPFDVVPAQVFYYALPLSWGHKRGSVSGPHPNVSHTPPQTPSSSPFRCVFLMPPSPLLIAQPWLFAAPVPIIILQFGSAFLSLREQWKTDLWLYCLHMSMALCLSKERQNSELQIANRDQASKLSPP